MPNRDSSGDKCHVSRGNLDRKNSRSKIKLAETVIVFRLLEFLNES